MGLSAKISLLLNTYWSYHSWYIFFSYWGTFQNTLLKLHLTMFSQFNSQSVLFCKLKINSSLSMSLPITVENKRFVPLTCNDVYAPHENRPILLACPCQHILLILFASHIYLAVSQIYVLLVSTFYYGCVFSVILTCIFLKFLLHSSSYTLDHLMLDNCRAKSAKGHLMMATSWYEVFEQNDVSKVDNKEQWQRKENRKERKFMKLQFEQMYLVA